MTARRTTGLGAALLCVALAATACGGQQPAAVPASSAGQTPLPAAALPVVPDDVGHLHGMGVDPADGRLYLATHAGLLAVDPDGVRRVGGSAHDLMGFVVAGERHFYASGHPGAGSDLPNPVGLIESRDAGLSWSPVSLAGASDFHALTAGAGRVYGFDGTLAASRDGRSWTRPGGEVAPASLAVHPANGDHVLATTRDGVKSSQDGGASFARVDGAPLLVFLSWPAGDQVWGVAPDGVVHASQDAGRTWQARSDVGHHAEALAATADGEVYVATAEAVLRSADGGRTFLPVAQR